MSITVKNDFGAFPSYLFWFAIFLDDNPSTHSQTTSQQKIQRSMNSQMQISEAGGGLRCCSLCSQLCGRIKHI